MKALNFFFVVFISFSGLPLRSRAVPLLSEKHSPYGEKSVLAFNYWSKPTMTVTSLPTTDPTYTVSIIPIDWATKKLLTSCHCHKTTKKTNPFLNITSFT